MIFLFKYNTKHLTDLEAINIVATIIAFSTVKGIVNKNVKEKGIK